MGGGKRNLAYANSYQDADLICKIVVSSSSSNNKNNNFDLSNELVVGRVVENVLKRGLGERVRKVRVSSSEGSDNSSNDKKRKKKSSSSTSSKTTTLTIAMKVDLQKSTKLVSRGPKPNNKSDAEVSERSER